MAHDARNLRLATSGPSGAAVLTQDILRVIQPIWQEKPETASRLRGRIEAVLDSARVAGHIPEREPNPARWGGHLEMLLPAPAKLARDHHAALAYGRYPGLHVTAWRPGWHGCAGFAVFNPDCFADR